MVNLDRMCVENCYPEAMTTRVIDWPLVVVVVVVVFEVTVAVVVLVVKSYFFLHNNQMYTSKG